LLNAGLRSVTISLDGLEDSHNWLRNNPRSFEKAVQAIGLLAKTDDLKFDVVTCVNERNFGELDRIKELLVSLGVKEWRLFTIFPVGRAKQNTELRLSPSSFKKVFDFMAAERKKGEIVVNYGCEGFLGGYEGEVRDSLFFCRAGINVASVLIDGSISACPNLRANFTQGNIYTDSFSETWGKKYVLHRNREWLRTGLCSNCEYFRYCEGNGLHLRDRETGELMFCHLHRIAEGELLPVK
jgi:radical SAM protein with 4Fe4S-binding SPASM domain